MSIKVIGSVKRYKPGRNVEYDHIRAMLHLAAQNDVSKAFIATTSRFPPKVLDYEDIVRAVPTRLELIDGEKLKNWLVTASANNAPLLVPQTKLPWE